ncbi:uncharacterized protein TNCV_2857851 [Trichonephila clavipes]|nr:uncharacterized protein TNCV_2857851 [Trichonephila clavipes]
MTNDGNAIETLLITAQINTDFVNHPVPSTTEPPTSLVQVETDSCESLMNSILRYKDYDFHKNVHKDFQKRFVDNPFGHGVKSLLPSQYGGYDPRLVTEWDRVRTRVRHGCIFFGKRSRTFACNGFPSRMESRTSLLLHPGIISFVINVYILLFVLHVSVLPLSRISYVSQDKNTRQQLDF